MGTITSITKLITDALRGRPSRTRPVDALTAKEGIVKPIKGIADSPPHIQRVRVWPKVATYSKNAWVGVYFLTVLAATYLLLLWNPRIGAYATIIAMAALLGLGVANESARKLSISVAIIPLALMFALLLPKMSMFFQLAVFYTVLLVLSWVYRNMFGSDREKADVPTKRKRYITLYPAIILGQIIGLFGAVVLRHNYTFAGQTFTGALIVLCTIAFALTEEWFFRGLVQQNASQIMHPAVAATLTALLYAVASIGLHSPLTFVVALVMGSILCIVYMMQQDLWITMTINTVAKLMFVGLFVIFGLR